MHVYFIDAWQQRYKEKKLSSDQMQKCTHLGLMEEEKWRRWRLPGRP